ncbi:MAG: GntR family transcriptional regulator [Planctomycetes bacterium]|nr:GntR family transcriptional regulator [Planctomycetota bacterium]
MTSTRPIARPETLKDLVYRRVRDLLLSGRLSAEDVHSANQLADTLGVSRTPVREALLQLAAEGILVPLKGRGYQVRRFSRREVREFFEAREAIECHIVAGLAAREDLALEALEQAGRRMADAADNRDREQFLAADEDFHQALLAQHGNRLLRATLENFRACILLMGYTALEQEGRMQEVLREHAAILHALRERDAAGAVLAMRRHLAATEAHLVDGRAESAALVEGGEHARHQHPA